VSEFDQEFRGMELAPGGKLYGFRKWVVRKGVLRSVGVWHWAWPKNKPMRALCPKGFIKAHSAPVPGCSCGLYAHRGLSALDDSENSHIDFAEPNEVRGVVSLWGRVIVHALGYRAEYAQVAALEASPRAEEVALAYGVPILNSLESWKEWS
jgi:hypothetical protein